MIPCTRRPGLRMRGYVAVFSLLALRVAAPAPAQDGKPLTDDQKNAVKCAIMDIESMADAETDEQRKKTLKGVAKCLSMSLGDGDKKIRREDNHWSPGAAETKNDGKESWEADLIKIKPEYLTKNEPNYSKLIAILVHEGIHAMQSGDMPTPDPKPVDPREWEGYSWEKAILKKRLEASGLTNAQRERIKERLKWVCEKHAEFCKPAQPPRKKKGNQSKGGSNNNVPSQYQSSYSYGIDPDQPNMIHIWDESTVAPLRSLPSSFAAVTELRVTRAPDGTDALFVFGSDPAFLVGGVERFRDTDADGLLDPATHAFVVPPGLMGLPHSVAADPNTPTLYVLDLAASNIEYVRVLLDLDVDGLPETLATLPFADGVAFPQLQFAETFYVQQPGVTFTSPLPHGADDFSPHQMRYELRDLDLNGQAEQFHTYFDLQRRLPDYPVFIGVPQSGDSVVSVHAAPNAFVQVFATDPNGDVQIEHLGSALATDPNWVNTMPLSRPLNPGEYIKAYDITNGIQVDDAQQVEPNKPEISRIQPGAALPGHLMTLHGRNFLPGTQVTCSGVPAAVVVQSFNLIQFIAPTVSQTPTGRVLVEATNDLGTSNFAGLLIHGDCNQNGLPDSEEIGAGLPDLDEDNVPDDCERASCPGDANGDGMIDNIDLQILLDAWATQVGDLHYDAAADFDASGQVENADLQDILDNWAQPCR